MADFCQHCRCDLDHPSPRHGINCPAYDGPPPEPEGLEELRGRVTEIEEHVTDLQRSRPLCCYDCGRRYEKGPDLVVSDEDWKKIAPHEDGGGVLCPNCMHDRFAALGMPDGSVRAVFKSGPFKELRVKPHTCIRGETTEAECEACIDARARNPEHYRLIDLMLKRPEDYQPWGNVERGADPQQEYPDCSGGCKFYRPLEGDLGADWGACTNPASHRVGLLTFEHQGCQKFEWDPKLEES